MRKKLVVGLVVSLATLLIAGGLYASNMAFKLNYSLREGNTGTPQAPVNSLRGVNVIALPFNQQTNLANASDLLNDIGGTAVVQYIQLWDRTEFNQATYTGTAGTPFPLVPGDGYFVQLKSLAGNRQYIIVGSDDPALVVTFDGQGPPESRCLSGGTSCRGINSYGWPYHSISNDASELLNELGGTAVIQYIQNWDKTEAAHVTYTGTAGTPFALVPGERYFVQLRPGVPSVSFIPAHY